MEKEDPVTKVMMAPRLSIGAEVEETLAILSEAWFMTSLNASRGPESGDVVRGRGQQRIEARGH